jgi:hypothetical protein
MLKLGVVPLCNRDSRRLHVRCCSPRFTRFMAPLVQVRLSAGPTKALDVGI